MEAELAAFFRAHALVFQEAVGMVHVPQWDDLCGGVLGGWGNGKVRFILGLRTRTSNVIIFLIFIMDIYFFNL